MNKYIIAIGSLLLIAALLVAQQLKIERLQSEKERYKTDTNTLLQQCQKYKVADSLNACKVGELTLSLKEYKQYRADDIALINELKAKNKDLAKAISGATATITPVTIEMRDTLIMRDTLTPARCIDFADRFTELHGCAVGDTFDGQITSRDSLLITEIVQYKRFLGFMWKTKKIKAREFAIVSRNPRTEIMGFDVVTLKK